MAENVTLARPYAEAVFSLACKSNTLESWSDALERMALVAADSQMRESFSNPKLSVAQLVQLFITIVDARLDIEQQNFVQVLAENARLQVLPEIRDLFILLKNKHEGVKAAIITSAFPLDEAALSSLQKNLEARFACRLDMRVSVDPSLIGGVKVAIGDEVIDASVRGKLAHMATALLN